MKKYILMDSEYCSMGRWISVIVGKKLGMKLYEGKDLVKLADEEWLTEDYLKDFDNRIADMSLEEVKVLFYLSGLEISSSIEEMAEITATKKSKLRSAIQKLSNRNMIRIQDKRILEGSKESSRKGEGKKNGSSPVTMEILPEAESVLKDILWAKGQFYQLRYEGMSEEEVQQYEILLEKIKANVQRMLK